MNKNGHGLFIEHTENIHKLISNFLLTQYLNVAIQQALC
jgi:hypothetical protein